MIIDGCKECGQSKKAAYDRDNAAFRVHQLEKELAELKALYDDAVERFCEQRQALRVRAITSANGSLHEP